MSALADVEDASLGATVSETEDGGVVSMTWATGRDSAAALVALDSSFEAIMATGVGRHSSPLPAAASRRPSIVCLIALGSFFLTLMPPVSWREYCRPRQRSLRCRTRRLPHR